MKTIKCSYNQLQNLLQREQEIAKYLEVTHNIDITSPDSTDLSVPLFNSLYEQYRQSRVKINKYVEAIHKFNEIDTFLKLDGQEDEKITLKEAEAILATVEKEIKLLEEKYGAKHYESHDEDEDYEYNQESPYDEIPEEIRNIYRERYADLLISRENLSTAMMALKANQELIVIEFE